MQKACQIIKTKNKKYKNVIKQLDIDFAVSGDRLPEFLVNVESDTMRQAFCQKLSLLTPTDLRSCKLW